MNLRTASLNSLHAGEPRDSVNRTAKPPNIERVRTPTMKCPYCNQEIGISIAALAELAFLLRTQCEKCKKEFLIVQGVPMTDEQYSPHSGPRTLAR